MLHPADPAEHGNTGSCDNKIEVFQISMKSFLPEVNKSNMYISIIQKGRDVFSDNLRRTISCTISNQYSFILHLQTRFPGSSRVLSSHTFVGSHKFLSQYLR